MITFEYLIAVSTGDIDTAKKKLTDLEKVGGNTTKKLEDGFKKVAQAQKENVGQLGAIAGTGKTALLALGKSFTSVGGSIKAVGAAIKANPILLLTTIVTEIVMAIVDFIKNLKFTIDIMDLLAGAIDYAIGLLKSLGDWLGITSFAEEDAAAAAIKSAEDRKAVNDTLYNSLIGDMEREISLMKAQGASIEDIEQKELELARTKAATAKAALKESEAALEMQIKLNKTLGISTADQVKQLEDLKNAAKDAQNALSITESSISKAVDERTVKADTDRKAEADKQRAANKAAGDRRKAAEEKRKAEEKAFAAERLRVERQIQDLSTAAIIDKNERELEQNRIKYERLIADTITNEKLLDAEKTALTDILRAEQKVKDEELKTTKINEDIAAETKRLNTIKDLELELATQRFAAVKDLEIDAEKLAIEQQLARITERAAAEEQLALEKQASDLEKLRQQLETNAITEEEFALRKILLAESTENQIDGIRKAAAAQQLDRVTKNAAKEKAIEQAKTDAIKGISTQLLDSISANLKEGSKTAKGIAVAQATYSTIESAIAAYKSVVGVPVVGPVLAVGAAAAATAFGVASVRKILSTSEGGGSPPDGPAPPEVTNIQAATQNITGQGAPQLNLFGQAGETGGDSTQFESTQGNGQPILRAVVSWTDIDAVANSDGNLRSEMQL